MRKGLAILLLTGSSLYSQSESVIYSPIGKRDPFHMPTSKSLGRSLASLNQLERFSLEQIQLKAILKGLGKNRAMFEDPEGKTHILSEGSALGREKATVSRILSREVIVTIRTFNYLGNETLVEKVVSLPSEDDYLPSGQVPEVLTDPMLRGKK